jgi:hypothetical protein
MKVSISGLKTMETLDAPAFTCNILVDGKKVGKAHDDGNGGETDFWFDDKTIREWFENNFKNPGILIENLINRDELRKSVIRRTKANAKKGMFTIWCFKRGTDKYGMGRETFSYPLDGRSMESQVRKQILFRKATEKVRAKYPGVHVIIL